MEFPPEIKAIVDKPANTLTHEEFIQYLTWLRSMYPAARVFVMRSNGEYFCGEHYCMTTECGDEV